MRFLIIGDIFGKKGRLMLQTHLTALRTQYQPDVVIVNDENMSHGRGPKMNQIKWLEEQGVDIFTGGNHVMDSIDEIAKYLDEPNSKQLRPDNIDGDDIPGTGHRILEKGGKKILVINLIGTAFIDEKIIKHNPFRHIDGLLHNIDTNDFEAIIVDFHKETTAEGYAMINFLDGRVSLLYGTHTHVQTTDAQIFPHGTGFISDIGFCGTRRSIIGMQWDEAIQKRYIQDLKEGVLSPDEKGPGILSGIVADIVGMKCTNIIPILISE